MEEHERLFYCEIKVSKDNYFRIPAHPTGKAPERLTCLPAAQTLLSTAHARRTQGLHCHGADELKLPG